jgi:hypothetical protein
MDDLTCAGIGPFRPDCSPTERAFWLGLLAGFSHSYCGGDSPVPDQLARAAFGGARELDTAREALDGLPALPRRKVLGSFARRTRPESRAITNGKARKSFAGSGEPAGDQGGAA